MKDEIDLSQLIQEQKDKELKLDARKQNKLLIKEILRKDKEIEMLLGMNVPREKPRPYKPLIKMGGAEGTAILFCSDFHWAEKILSRTVNNLNRYDPEVAAKRLERLFRKGLFWINHGRNITKINRLIIAVLGDMKNNWLHDEDRETNYMTPSVESLAVEEHLERGIDFMLANGKFKEIEVIYKFGNHGRQTQRNRYGNGAETNDEYLIAHHLAKQYRNKKNVVFTIEDGYLTHKKIYNKIYCFQHGHAIRYGGGVMGMGVPFKKAIDNWNKSKYADWYFSAHFHTSIIDPSIGYLSNGSGVGYNAYAIGIKARYERPKQYCVIVDNKNGLIDSKEVFLDKDER